MQLRRFRASTVVEAYERVRDALGDDAVIVATRSGGSDAPVEVVAGLPDGEAGGSAGAPTFDQDAAAHELVRGVAEAVAAGEPLDGLLDDPGTSGDGGRAEAPPFLNELAGSALRAGGPFDIFDAPGDPDAVQAGDDAVSTGLAMRPPSGGERLLREMAAQLADVRSMVESISLERASERIDQAPEALHEARSRLVDQGVAPSALIPVLDDAAKAIVPEATPPMVLQTVERKLAARLPAVVSLDLGMTPLTVFVVGPGGSGKTSVAVRLGLELAASRGARVALAGVDVHRVGAPQQLTAYGAATGLPVRLCYSPGELKSLLAERSADVLIVDTPGCNGSRGDRMAELHAFKQVARRRCTLLALPATGKGDDLSRVTSAFAAAELDGLVLTRCDETESFGALLSAACESAVGIAYTTHGEAISDGLREGDNHALAVAILGARWPQSAATRRVPAPAV